MSGRQLWVGGIAGPPPGVPADHFVTAKRSKPRAASPNGYLIVCEALLAVCPWGSWDALREQGARLRVARDTAGNRIAVRLDPAGERPVGKMPGWISENVMVGDMLAGGLVEGRHPARWEQEEDGAWALIAYPRVIQS